MKTKHSIKSKVILKIKDYKFIRVLTMPIVNIERRCLLHKYQISDDAKKLLELKNSHEGERCFIIGNGPSLNLEDLEKLKNEFTFGANRIYTAFDKTSWRPRAYVCVDRESFRIYGKELLSIDAEYIIFEHYGKKYIKTNNKTYFLYSYAPFKKNYSISGKFSADISEGIYSGQTVTFASIQIAAYMGFKEIYLIGVDHNYSKTIDRNGNVNVNKYVNNYSDLIVDTGLGVNYIDGTTEAYKVAKKYCENNNILIKNATRGGKLEIFERVNLDEVLNENKA